MSLCSKMVKPIFTSPTPCKKPLIYKKVWIHYRLSKWRLLKLMPLKTTSIYRNSKTRASQETMWLCERQAAEPNLSCWNSIAKQRIRWRRLMKKTPGLWLWSNQSFCWYSWAVHATSVGTQSERSKLRDVWLVAAVVVHLSAKGVDSVLRVEPSLAA